MKVYKSRIMGLISKNVVKARKFKRGTIDRYGSSDAFFEIERGKVTFVQGKYALESNISTAVSNDAETGIYRCNDELFINARLMFEIDNFGNAVQGECHHNKAFEVLNKPCNYHELICTDRANDPKFSRFDRKLLVELLSYFDGDTIKIRLIDTVGGGYKYLQIQDRFSRAILMPMKDID
nr:MAG: hypothetical protein [Bacteriophage sp.]